MAKQKPATPDDEAEQAAKKLLAFWNAGKESWGKVDPDNADKKRKKDEVKYAHGNKLDLLRGEAARIGMNHDTLKKAWKVGREYTREQIDELCDLIVKHDARFSATHLTRLLGINNRQKRDALTRTAIKNRWGVTALERRFQAMKGGRRLGVGRQPRIPTTEDELLMALSALCDKWENFCERAKANLPKEMTAVVKDAVEAVKTVKDAADKRAKKSSTGKANK